MALRKIALLTVLAASAALAADSGLLKLVMPNATTLAGIHVDQTRSTPFGKFVIAQMTRDDQFNKLATTAGFDPSRDLHEMIAASASGGSQDSGLLVARGTFDKTKLLGLASQMGVKMSKYQGVDVLMPPQPKEGQTAKRSTEPAFAFLDGGAMLAGEPDLVRGAIDRSRGGAPLDAKMLAQVQQISSRNDIWIVTSAPLSQLSAAVPNPTAGAAMRGDVVQSITSTSAGIKFGSSALISGEAVTRSEKDANALADVIRFFIGMLQLQNNNPGVPQVLSKLEAVDLRTDGAVLKFSFSIPESLLEQFATPSGRHARKKGAELD